MVQYEKDFKNLNNAGNRNDDADDDHKYIHSKFQSRPINHNLPTRFISKHFPKFNAYLSNSLTVSLINIISALILSIFIYSILTLVFNGYNTNKSVSLLNHNFFEENTFNYNFYDKLNKKLSPKYNQIGFTNNGLQKIRLAHGAPPMKESPNIHENLKSADSTGFSRVINSAYNFVSGKKKDSKKIYLIIGNSSNFGISQQISKETWLMKKLSILNKKEYVEKHGYELIIINSLNSEDSISSHQKRYQHESRESWEKFDILKNLMSSTANDNSEKVDEWFWYIDIFTLIMEPDLSIDTLIFNNFKKINFDNIDLVLTNDCNGINLNSFLIKKSSWSNLFLDILWEPVFYRQMHSNWIKLNKNAKIDSNFLNSIEIETVEEKNCLQYLLTSQPWLKKKILFVPNRIFNSLSVDYCPIIKENYWDLDDDILDELLDENFDINDKIQNSKLSRDSLNSNQNFHYNESENDFLVNFMNCEKNNNCWLVFRKYLNIYQDKNNYNLFN